MYRKIATTLCILLCLTLMSGPMASAASISNADKTALSSCLQQEYLMRDTYQNVFAVYPTLSAFSAVVAGEISAISTLKNIFAKYRITMPYDAQTTVAKSLAAAATSLANADAVGISLEQSTVTKMTTLGKTVKNRDVINIISSIKMASSGSHTNAFIAEQSSLTAPSSPTLLSPANGVKIDSTSPLLSWQPATRASSYAVQLSTDSAFSSICYSTSLSGLSVTVSLLANATTYYWRVNAANAYGISAWSNAYSFTTPSPIPEPPLTEKVVQFTPSDTQATFLSLLSDETVDVIELNGTYHLPYTIIDIDRTNPIVVRPAAGATVVMSGAEIGPDPQFWFGLNGKAGNITMTGLIFDGFVLGQQGIIQGRDVHDIALNNMVVRNSRANGTTAEPYHSWAIYLSSTSTIQPTNFTANNWTVDGSNKQMSALQVYGGTNVTFTGWTVSNCYYAVYASNTRGPITNLVLDQWKVADCGAPAWGNDNVAIAVEYASGTYSNIHMTNSGIIMNVGTPRLTDGGGNTSLDENARPFAAPVTVRTVSVPSTIDSTGLTDASGPLNNFIESVPDGSIISFLAGTTYRLDKGLQLANRHNIVFDGHGATLVVGAGAQGSDQLASSFALGHQYGGFWDGGNTDIAVHNFVLSGNSTSPGVFLPGEEHLASFEIFGCERIEISGCSASGYYGDFVKIEQTTSAWVHDNNVKTVGRNGVSVISGKDAIFERNTFGTVGYCVFDVEPNTGSESVYNVKFLNNTADSWDCSFLSVEGSHTGAIIDGIIVDSNTVMGGTIESVIDNGGTGRMKNIAFINNIGMKPVYGPILIFSHVDGLTVYGNTQPLESESLTRILDCTMVEFSPSGLSRPFSAPVTTCTVTVPASIDATGTTDVSTALTNFFHDVPDGSLVNFPSSAVYRVDKAVFLNGRHNLILNGNGCTLKYMSVTGTSQSYSFWYDEGSGSDIWIKNFILIGSSTHPGVYTPGTSPTGGEYQHGVVICSSHFEVSGCTVSSVWGDGFIIFNGASGVWIHDNHVISAGRNGLSVISGSNVLTEHNTFDKAGGSIFDVEPELTSDSCTNIVFRNNTIGTYGGVYGFNVVNQAAAAINGIVVDNNIATGSSLSTYVDSVGAVRMVNVTFTNDVSKVTAAGPVLYFKHIDGLVVTGNVQPLTSGEIMWITDCSEIVT